MWDPEPWLQLQLLALHKNGLHISYLYDYIYLLKILLFFKIKFDKEIFL